MTLADQRRRRLFALWLALASAGLCAIGLLSGSEGWSVATTMRDLTGPDAGLVIGQIRAPRTKVALAVGKGKAQYDKREDLKRREADRELKRATMRRRTAR